MINIYYRKNTSSSKKALDWFQAHSIFVDKHKMDQIPWDELIRLLSLTENGMSDILKRTSKVNRQTKKKIDYLMELSFNEAIYYMKSHTEILQDPIIIENQKYLVGYNKDEIRQFIPKDRLTWAGDARAIWQE
ncbi:ArsC/Spx/MgsR family protein [Lactococcus garvieae]|uniref:ArsC/Spx/MgsR family protein n=1 Tax=Lactococcus garvieae TaxID=1363 RepID=UPI003851EB51